MVRMKTKTMKPGLFIGVDGLIKTVEIDTGADLQPYYDLIGTDIVEHTQAKIFGKVVDIWCDEEGGFRPDARVNLVLQHLTGQRIAGSVVIHGRSLDAIVTAMRLDGWAFADEEDDDDDATN